MLGLMTDRHMLTLLRDVSMAPRRPSPVSPKGNVLLELGRHTDVGRRRWLRANSV